MGLRDQLRALKALAKKKLGIGVPEPDPGMVMCYRRGEPSEGGEVETRPVGVHRGGPGCLVVDIVFETNEERERLVSQAIPEGAYPPMVITFGPREIEPPADLPRA